MELFFEHYIVIGILTTILFNIVLFYIHDDTNRWAMFRKHKEDAMWDVYLDYNKIHKCDVDHTMSVCETKDYLERAFDNAYFHNRNKKLGCPVFRSKKESENT